MTDRAAAEGFGERSTLSEVALKSVMRLIRSGELRPGAVVNEADLAKRLGMSRGPVREAVRTLEGRRIVSREPYQRARVAMPDPRQIAELFEMREALEGMAVRLATRRMSEAALTTLASSTAVLHPQQASFVLTDTSFNFHLVIAEACGNTTIRDTLVNDIYDVVRFYRWMSKPVTETPDGHAHEHWQVVQAMLARDEDHAEQLMRAHIRRVQGLVTVG